MPLPVLPENNTDRYFVDYSFNGETRTWSIRVPASTGASGARTIASNFFGELEVILCTGWSFGSARYQEAGSPVSLPVLAPAEPSPGGGPLNPVQNPRFVSWIGRGFESGRRWRSYVYGLAFGSPEDYRLSTEENAAIASAQNVLAAAGLAGTLITIEGDAINVYEYTNVGFNAYHQRQARG